MYAPTSAPFVKRTRATFRRAEFGFFGVVVETRVQTPRFCGAPASAGVFVFAFFEVRPLRMSWFTVGMLRLMSLWSGVPAVVCTRMAGGARGSHRTGWPWYRNGQGIATVLPSQPWSFFRVPVIASP